MKKGLLITVEGTDGAGKSTLLKIIAGEIFFSLHNLAEFPCHEGKRRENVALSKPECHLIAVLFGKQYINYG